MKRDILPLVLALFAVFSFAETTSVLVEITGVAVGRGDVYVAVYDDPDAYKKDKYLDGKQLAASGESLQIPMELSAGDYVFSVYQDINGNGKLDKKAFGIPKEAVGISNYDGKGFPGGFEKLKVAISGKQQRVVVRLFTL